MAQDIKKIIAQEYIKCAKDPAYFMKKYCYIQHPTRGRILFNLYPFQGKVLHLFKDHQYLITLKSRQLGISTLAAAYSLWLMLFHKDKNVLALATTQATARNLVTKTMFMYDQLPKWLKLPAVEKNKLSLRLKNGSKITAKSSNADAARSEAVSLLLIDEAAFIDNIDETFAAAQQTLATGGQCMALSTPNGIGNWFHQTWEKAESGENSFLPIRLPWTVHPERNKKWREQQDADLGPKMAGQECDCDFLASGDTVFEPDDMSFYEQTYQKDPLERRGVDGNFWVWEGVDYTKSYMVVADVARGDGRDYSAFHIFDIETATQVGEYKGKIAPRDFGNMLVGIAAEYNEALLVIENANIGWATIEQVMEREYRNLFYSATNNMETVETYMHKFERDKLVPGFTMSARSRPLVIAKMIEYIRDHSATIQSKRLMSEMRVFVWKNGKAQAQDRYNDDLIISCATALYVRDTALRLRQQGIDLARAQLSSFTNLNAKNKAVIKSVGSQQNNPYIIDNGRTTEDISWILK
ncbi:terminase family protein [bacterium]|nr:terminase family protein [bacterium]